MAYDTDIYKQNLTPDILGSVQRGLSISDALQERQAQRAQQEKQQAVNAAYKKSIVFNPDGSASVDYKALNSNIAQVAPEMVGQLQEQQQKQQMGAAQLTAAQYEAANKELAAIGQIFSSAKDPNSYAMALNRAKAKNLDISEFPQQYDPRFVQSTLDQGLSLKEQLQEKWNAMNYNQKEREIGLKRDEAKAKLAESKTPEARLAKMNSGDKARYDNSKLGLEYVQQMDKALQGGDWTVSLVGSNNFTDAQNYAAEAFGRMQSGGAINKDEEARFKKMAPTATDSQEMQVTKLKRQQKLFVDRLKTMGFTPEEAGIQVQEISYGKDKIDPIDSMTEDEVRAAYQLKFGINNANN